jgi:hypothetical protein
MTLRYYTRKELAAAAALRPPGYLEEMMLAAVSEGGDRVTFDTEHPAYLALEERYRTAEKIEVWRRRTVLLDAVTLQPVAGADAKEWGPKLWGELHRFCLTAEARDPEKLTAHVGELRRRLPCGECRAGLREWLAEDPPDASDPFAWSVRLHNWVNAKPSLNKPQLSVEEARAIHGGGDRAGVAAASIDN